MKSFVPVLAIIVCVLHGLARPGLAEIILPGTQPGEKGVEFAKVAQCIMCHAKTNNGEADPVFSWQGSLMAQAARDPVFLATMSISNQDVPGVGEFCLRCHAPRGWVEGRSKPADASALTPEDMHGVSCDVCHRLVDPLSAEAKKLAQTTPPGYGNAMMVVDPANVVRGPYPDCQGAMPHGTAKSEFHASGQLCGVCHNLSNPMQAKDVNTQPPHAFGHIERTYSEWSLSDFAKQGRKGTCQSCHYPTVAGGGQASRFGGPRRDYFVRHGPPGGSTWVQDAIARLWPTKDINAKALKVAQEKTRELLRTAASLDLRCPPGGKGSLRITNRTGHKLPTGYPEGRRMWVNLVFRDPAGTVIKEVGRYGDKKDTLAGQPVTAPTLLDPEQTRVYECLPAISEEQSKKTGKPAGPSFHFVLNDTIAKDTRIPPRGFKNAAFAEHQCAPVGATYADGQHWDDVEFAVPDGAKTVTARLLYQSVSWEYIKFLAEQNKSDERGKRLYEVWTQTGRCPPEAIAEVTTKVGG